MAHHYLNPDDASNPSRLPNIETFEARYGYCDECQSLAFDIMLGKRMPCGDPECRNEETSVSLEEVGWFYCYGLPGNVPDSEPMGPFETEELALKDARAAGFEEKSDA